MPAYNDPFSQMMSLSEAINRMLQDSFVLPRTALGTGRYQFYPRMDVMERGDEYLVKLNLPGWKPQDVDVSINGNTVTIHGKESQTMTEPQGGQPAQGQQGQAQQGQQQRHFYHLREREVTDFERSFTFPTDINADQAKAEFENGVLTLTLPKAEAAKTRRIPIGGAQQRQLGAQAQGR